MPSPSLFWQGITQFNQQQYYPCHDTFEELWMNAEVYDRAFYQGLLQIAVGCYHLSNFNWRGAVTLLGEGIRRLEDYEPTYSGIDISDLLDQSSDLLDALQAIGEQNLTSDYLQQTTLPKIVTVEGESNDSQNSP